MSSGQAMPTQATLDTNAVSSARDSNNNDGSVATGSLTRAWNRLSSRAIHASTKAPSYGRRRERKGREHSPGSGHRKAVMWKMQKLELHCQRGRQVEARATRRQPSQFTSTAFNRMPQPVPVADIFFGSWWARLGATDRGRLVNLFENPKLGAHTDGIVRIIRNMTASSSALELHRTHDAGAISAVVAIPPAASLIFGITWVQVYTHRGDGDIQIIVQTAFTVASYIVTAGVLTLALIAFLDQKRAQNDDMMDKLARRSVETKPAATSSKLDRRFSLP